MRQPPHTVTTTNEQTGRGRISREETTALWDQLRASSDQIQANNSLINTVSGQVREVVQQVANISASVRELSANDQAHVQRLDSLTADIRNMRDRQDKQQDDIGNLKAGIQASITQAISTAMTSSQQVEQRAQGAIAGLRGKMGDDLWSLMMVVVGGAISYFVYHH